MSFSFDHAAQEIIRAGNWLDSMDYAPATGGNYSMRIGAGEMAITVSGVHKGRLKPDHIMRADFEGHALDGKKPSAETLLHCGLYKTFADVNAILHTHSVPCTVLSRHYKDEIILEGYELLKVFPGIKTHETSIRLPIFDNDQDIARLQTKVDVAFKKYPETKAYLIRGHGLYAWGADMEQAMNIVEGAEFLLSCELETLKLKAR